MKNFNSEIVPGKGTSELYLGMPLSQLQQLILNLTYEVDYKITGGYFTCIFDIKEAVKVTVEINPNNAKAGVTMIEFYGRYLGYFNGLQIGSPVTDAIKSGIVTSFDEHYLVIGQSYSSRLLIEIDNSQQSIYSFDEVKDGSIIKFIVKNRLALD